jgi:hypothetical protein
VRQFLAARSIVEVAIRPRKHLTEQANSRFTRSIEATTSRHFFSDYHLSAVSPHLYVGTRQNWPIEIGYGEDLTE